MTTKTVVQLEYPMVIAQEIPEISAQETFSRRPLMSHNKFIEDGTLFRGVASKDGKWLVDPGAGWTITKKDTGLFTVQHLLGWTNTTLSVSLMTQPGSVQIVEHGLVTFTVQCVVAGKPADLGFCFVLSRVLSLSA